MTKTEDIAGKFLGKKVEGKSQYDPSFLVAVPRQENRTYLGLDESNYPEGFDTWYGYEFSMITNNGIPVNRVIKIVYPSSTKCIVESKSLKLYLNSFALTKMGDTVEDALTKALETIKKDLSDLLKADIQVSFLTYSSTKDFLFGEYEDLGKMIRPDLMVEKNDGEDKSLLEINGAQNPPQEHKFTFQNLRSRCRITAQPDWGNLFIYYKSQKTIDVDSLFKYLCSFRAVNKFHEECTETIFTRLSNILDKEDELIVTALYTRRGGIDINPCRYQNISDKDHPELVSLRNPNVFSRYIRNMMQ